MRRRVAPRRTKRLAARPPRRGTRASRRGGCFGRGDRRCRTGQRASRSPYVLTRDRRGSATSSEVRPWGGQRVGPSAPRRRRTRWSDLPASVAAAPPCDHRPLDPVGPGDGPGGEGDFGEDGRGRDWCGGEGGDALAVVLGIAPGRRQRTAAFGEELGVQGLPGPRDRVEVEQARD